MTLIPGFAETVVASGINRPVQMQFAPDGRLFVAQQSGQLRVIKNGQLLPTPFLTVTPHDAGERGLISVTFDPDFADNHHLYIYYTAIKGPDLHVNRVSRFTANGDVAAAGSEEILFEGDPLGPSTWHNSGGMHFGLDGKLYVSMGDNEHQTPVPRLDSTFGKVLRINPDGSIPTDNPFYNQASGKYRAIWALGFRNPFTFDLQPSTGRIFVNDVGRDLWEEINELKKGANYGWPSSEGPTTNPAHETPFYAYPHAPGDTESSAIAGASFYEPEVATFPSDYVGDFFFGDYGLGTIRRIDPGTKQVSDFASNVTEIVDVEVGPDGALYYAERAVGRVFRVQAATSAAPSVAVHPQDQTVATGQPVTFTVSANGAGLSYQWRRDGADIAGATSESYTIPVASAADDGATFDVVVTNGAGSATSDAATLTVQQGNTAPLAVIASPTEGTPWAGGSSINFSGTGTDAEDGTLPASAFTWSVDLHHDTHTHPFIAPYPGVTSGTFQISDAGHGVEHNIWYRIHLTVTDSQGIATSAFRDVFPQKVNLALQTDPPGLPLNLDSSPEQTPYGSPAVVGFQRELEAPQTQVVGGVTYHFDGWSDGNESPTREVTIPAADVTYTARYRAASPLAATLRETAVPASVQAGMRLSGKSAIEVRNSSAASVVGAVQARLVLVHVDAPDTKVAVLASATRSLTLAPGATKLLKLPAFHTFPEVPDGDYLLVAEALAPNGAASSAAQGQSVAVSAPRRDLLVTGVSPSSSTIGRRSNKVRVTLANAGNVRVRGRIDVELAVMPQGDGESARRVLSTRAISVNLAPGRSKVLTLRVLYSPQLPPGTYTLTATLDPQSLLGEDDAARSNNLAVADSPIQVG